MTTQQTSVSDSRLDAVASAYKVTPEQQRDAARLVRRKVRNRADAEQILTALGIPQNDTGGAS